MSNREVSEPTGAARGKVSVYHALKPSTANRADEGRKAAEVALSQSRERQVDAAAENRVLIATMRSMEDEVHKAKVCFPFLALRGHNECRLSLSLSLSLSLCVSECECVYVCPYLCQSVCLSDSVSSLALVLPS
jgi:hypothetical protein